jgi:hypothetical protein
LQTLLQRQQDQQPLASNQHTETNMNKAAYNETFAACQAGGMSNDQAHDYATDFATRIEVLKYFPWQMREKGWTKAGTTDDRTAMVEIKRDYEKAGKQVVFTKGAFFTVHYWVK